MSRRLVLTAAAIALAGTVVGSPAHADPQCTAEGCPHGTASAPPPANVNSPSYKDGYKTEHDYFSTPQNHSFLASEIKNGYTAGLACQVEAGGGAPPPNLNDWLAGCVDALHDLGFKP